MTAYVIIHTTVDDTETHHREIVPKIMRAVERHGGKRIALGHGEQLRVHLGEPPNANRLVVHEFPSLESCCSIVSGWRDQPQVRFSCCSPTVRAVDCSKIRRSLNSYRLQSGIRLRRRESAAPTDRRIRVEWRKDR